MSVVHANPRRGIPLSYGRPPHLIYKERGNPNEGKPHFPTQLNEDLTYPVKQTHTL